MSYPLLQLFNLRHDQDSPKVIDETVRESIALHGSNLWVLIFAIVIACIGLNMNSTAVIIGAMLISPLMAPIVGIGYGAGIKDYGLIKKSLRSFLYYVAIALFSSTVYFWVTPLTQADSELLARTTPSLWDVLIAFSGGAVGMIAATRRNSSNVIPGVAIATALMPPLCTAGYGLANGNWQFLGGALFLFLINTVFIAYATLLVVKLLRLPIRTRVDIRAERWMRHMINLVVFATIIPSGYLAYRLVQQDYFTRTVHRIVQELHETPNMTILAKELNVADKSIRITIGGSTEKSQVQHEIEQKLINADIQDAQVIVQDLATQKIDIGTIQQNLRQELYDNTLKQLTISNEENARLTAQIQNLQTQQKHRTQLSNELFALYPEVLRVTTSTGETIRRTNSTELVEPTLVVVLNTRNKLSTLRQQRLKMWLSEKFPKQNIELIVK